MSRGMWKAVETKAGETRIAKAERRRGKRGSRKKMRGKEKEEKIWNHTIDMKEGFVPRKGKVYPLSREEREEVHEFIKEQLRKEYIRSSKLLQTALVFFVEKKDGKKRIVQNY